MKRSDRHLPRRADTESRLAHALAIKLSEITETTIQWREINIYPARGYWRQVRADVMQFTGDFPLNGVRLSFGCWESMTICLRNGFTVRDTRNDSRRSAYGHFEISALEKRD